IVVRPGGALSRQDERTLERLTRRLPAALQKLDLTPAERDLLRPLLNPPAAPDPAAEAGAAVELTIKGVVRLPTEADFQEGRGRAVAVADVLLPQKTAEELFLRGPGRAGFYHASAAVGREDDVKGAVRASRVMGLEANA